MNKFSEKSLGKLNTCDQRLQQLVWTLATDYDITVTCGYRGKDEQNILHKNGKSKVKYPNSKHNNRPSQAIDMVLHPMGWQLMNGEWMAFAKAVQRQWNHYNPNTTLIWGGDWENFRDKAHWEIKDDS